jgi:tRNA (cmo5U34)-methyltransferase
MKQNKIYTNLELWIPQHDYCIELLVDCLENRTSVTDIGIGSGNVAEQLLKVNPHLNLYGIDIDATALTAAEKRLAQYPNVTLSECDMQNVRLKSTELIVSALSIHHLERAEQEVLFAKIYHALTHQGCFAHFEIVDGHSVSAKQRNMEYGRSFPQSKGIPKQSIEDAIIRMEEKDKALDFESHKKIMEKLGFNFRPLHLDHHFCVYRCDK